MSKPWTTKEIQYLEESWGNISLPTIAGNLNRSTMAVKLKAQRMHLGAALENGDYITLNQLIAAVTGSEKSYSYKMKSWVENRGLPVHKRKVDKNSFRVVYIDEFWVWAEQNKSFIDFSKMEPMILGKEPEWVDKQRRKDFEAYAIQRKDPWTPTDDERLRFYLKQQKYGYAELSEMLKRSAGAIQQRCIDLGLKDRPVKADNHGSCALWNDAMFDTVAEGINNGDSYSVIAAKIGKSEKAVRGKVYSVYLTENADKIRKMINGGKWGDGAPEPALKQARTLSQHRSACVAGISSLLGVLKLRMNDLGYGTYWQKEMCMNWDDYKGCKAQCDNCDECTEFLRIKVQYCARCGTDFYERIKNRFCSKCRTARKRKAQRHWATVNRKTAV